MKDMKEIRPHIWFGALVIVATVVGLMCFNLWSAKPNIVRNANVSVAAVQFERPATMPAVKPAIKTDDDIAPETVAMLARVGLPATNLSKITVVAHPRPPNNRQTEA